MSTTLFQDEAKPETLAKIKPAVLEPKDLVRGHVYISLKDPKALRIAEAFKNGRVLTRMVCARRTFYYDAEKFAQEHAFYATSEQEAKIRRAQSTTEDDWSYCQEVQDLIERRKLEAKHPKPEAAPAIDVPTDQPATNVITVEAVPHSDTSVRDWDTFVLKVSSAITDVSGLGSACAFQSGVMLGSTVVWIATVLPSSVERIKKNLGKLLHDNNLGALRVHIGQTVQIQPIPT